MKYLITKYLIIILCGFGFIATVKADSIRLEFSVAIPLPLTKDQELKLITMKDALIGLQVDFSPDTKIITSNTMKTHICHHDTGQLCTGERELADTDFVKLNENTGFVRLECNVEILLPLSKEQETKLTTLKDIMTDLQIDFKPVTTKIAGNTIKTDVLKYDSKQVLVEGKAIADTDFTKIVVFAPEATPIK